MWSYFHIIHNAIISDFVAPYMPSASRPLGAQFGGVSDRSGPVCVQREEALLNDLEVTGQAFEDMQEQNLRLLQQLREKDDANFKLMSEVSTQLFTVFIVIIHTHTCFSAVSFFGLNLPCFSFLTPRIISDTDNYVRHPELCLTPRITTDAQNYVCHPELCLTPIIMSLTKNYVCHPELCLTP